jgi:hypothetical protein
MPTKVRDCDFEVDYTFVELGIVDDCIEQLDEIGKSEQSAVITNIQRLLKPMEKRLLHSYKIPLSEATLKAFHVIQAPVDSVDEFSNNTLPALAHSLLYDMLNNYCGCKSSTK